jgi:hypothetical protein
MSKAKLPKVTVPRSLKEIQTEYNTLRVAVADSQYSIFVHTDALKSLNQRMLELNKEGQARMELDKQAAAQVPENKETASEL